MPSIARHFLWPRVVHFFVSRHISDATEVFQIVFNILNIIFHHFRQKDHIQDPPVDF